MMNPHELLKTIDAAYDAYLTEGRGAKYNPKNLYAGGYHPCFRYHYLNLRHHAELPDFPPETLARFKRGQNRERDILIDLNRIGQYHTPRFEIVGAQERIQIDDPETGVTLITGKIDSFIMLDRKRYPIEIKSWHPNLAMRMNSIHDLLNNQWTRKAAYQLAIYLHATGSEFGFFVLDDPAKYRWIVMQYADAEPLALEYIEMARLIMTDYHPNNEAPDFHDDPTECKSCPFFGAFCNPPTDSREGAVILDEETEQLIARYLELRECGKEYASLDKYLKQVLRGVETGICKTAIVIGKWQRFTRYELPDDVKKQIKALKEPYKIVDPKGSFRLKIEEM